MRGGCCEGWSPGRCSVFPLVVSAMGILHASLSCVFSGVGVCMSSAIMDAWVCAWLLEHDLGEECSLDLHNMANTEVGHDIYISILTDSFSASDQVTSK